MDSATVLGAEVTVLSVKSGRGMTTVSLVVPLAEATLDGDETVKFGAIVGNIVLIAFATAFLNFTFNNSLNLELQIQTSVQ